MSSIPNPDAGREQALAKARDAFVETLAKFKSLAPSHIEVQYDGEGDEGSVHTVLGYADAEPIELPDAVRNAVSEYVERLVYREYPGWENNEGAMGTAMIDLASREVTLEHSTRYTDYAQTVKRQAL